MEQIVSIDFLDRFQKACLRVELGLKFKIWASEWDAKQLEGLLASLMSEGISE
jgi:hypothetical protein